MNKNIQKLNICSKTDISKSARINACIMLSSHENEFWGMGFDLYL